MDMVWGGVGWWLGVGVSGIEIVAEVGDGSEDEDEN